jgi:hypothetical protein
MNYKKHILIFLFFISIILSSFVIESFTTNDLVIHDTNKPTYNIGDLMLMYFYYDNNALDKPQYDNNKEDYFINYINKNKIYYDAYPNSIFSNYIKLLDENRKINIDLPNIKFIQNATDIFYNNNKENIDRFFNTINNEHTLFVHIRSGDKGVIDDSFINTVRTLEHKYEKIIIICGAHNVYNDEAKNTLINDINKIMNDKYIINIDEPDYHLCYFRKCKNLLVCKGGFSGLGCILFNVNNLYYMPTIMNKNGIYNETWIKYINTKNITYL